MTFNRLTTSMLCFAAGSLACAGSAFAARDQVKIAGSSTVLPYANIVAEQFGKTFNKYKTPIVESGGKREAQMVRDFAEVPRDAERVIFFPPAAGG